MDALSREILARLRDQSPDNATLPKDLGWFDEQISKGEAAKEHAPDPGSGSATARNGRGWLSQLLGRSL